MSAVPGIANDVAAAVASDGIAALETSSVMADLEKNGTDKKSASMRAGAAASLLAMSKTCGVAAEPYLMKALPWCLDLAADKEAGTRDSAADAVKYMISEIVSPSSVHAVVPYLLEALEFAKKWQTKVLALEMVSQLAKSTPEKVQKQMPSIIPAVTPCMNDSKAQVASQAHSTMSDVCKVCGNNDIQPFVPRLVDCMAKPSQLHDCIHGLAATTFVQAVEAPHLAIIVPLLNRGLQDRVQAIQRKSCLIADNMAKLVDDELHAAPFLPSVMPLVKRVSEEVADPEVRNVASKALKTLQRIEKDAAEISKVRSTSPDWVATQLKEAGGQKAPAAVQAFIVNLAMALIDDRSFEDDEWVNTLTVPYLSAHMPEGDAKKAGQAFVEACRKEDERQEAELHKEDDEEGEDLCKCDFSLAYGAKILLNNTGLHLKRGKRYGLCGPNGCGKSTLMRAISNGQVEGFPPPEELKTVYVEHDLDDSEVELTVLEYLANWFSEKEPSMGVTKDVVHEQLSAVGFSEELLNRAVGALSGGWKMKLALSRAILLKADILLLDEPTNHLDVANVQWLMDYLCSMTSISSMIVSHDSGFLETVCTHIIHYENRKLKLYRGNLSEFVKQVPEAASYYSLEESTVTWKFPEPGYLEGVKTKDKAILKMTSMNFTYPGADKPQLTDVNVQVSLSSRVGCIGANGAGKSTLIKCLTGELEATEGNVWRHPNCRIAYVAQHAFHHIEKHLDKTPNQYIQWRYVSGEDREEQEKSHIAMTEDEIAKMHEKIKMDDGSKRAVEKLVSRRKAKGGGYEYEVRWKDMSSECDSWMTRQQLELLGVQKLVNDMDSKEAARLGLMTRPLTTAAIEKHLNDLGLEPEFSTHSLMKGLSGGQKVKVVLGAAMWNNPHILVMDEPTNFLDRDSLGALAMAIKDYNGGVVVISHNREFTSTVCPEEWLVGDGGCKVVGAAYDLTKRREKIELKRQEEVTDAFGNTIKVKAPKKKLSRKESKARVKARAARRERGEEVTPTTEEDA